MFQTVSKMKCMTRDKHSLLDLSMVSIEEWSVVIAGILAEAKSEPCLQLALTHKFVPSSKDWNVL